MTNEEYLEKRDGSYCIQLPTIISVVLAKELFNEYLMDLSNDSPHDFTKWKNAHPDDYEKIVKAYKHFCAVKREYFEQKEKDW